MQSEGTGKRNTQHITTKCIMINGVSHRLSRSRRYLSLFLSYFTIDQGIKFLKSSQTITLVYIVRVTRPPTSVICPRLQELASLEDAKCVACKYV